MAYIDSEEVYFFKDHQSARFDNLQVGVATLYRWWLSDAKDYIEEVGYVPLDLSRDRRLLRAITDALDYPKRRGSQTEPSSYYHPETEFIISMFPLIEVFLGVLQKYTEDGLVWKLNGPMLSMELRVTEEYQ